MKGSYRFFVMVMLIFMSFLTGCSDIVEDALPIEKVEPFIDEIRSDVSEKNARNEYWANHKPTTIRITKELFDSIKKNDYDTASALFSDHTRAACDIKSQLITLSEYVTGDFVEFNINGSVVSQNLETDNLKYHVITNGILNTTEAIYRLKIHMYLENDIDPKEVGITSICIAEDNSSDSENIQWTQEDILPGINIRYNQTY